jgi:hypothetical protein
MLRSKFRISPHCPLTQMTATRLAWESTFKGDLADVLLETIADYLSRERTPYVRLTSMINSSGTGKSRVVDQLGKEVITVPMCLSLGGDGLFVLLFLYKDVLFTIQLP